LSTTKAYRQLTLEPADNRRLAALCGQFDNNLHYIERHLGVEISNRLRHAIALLNNISDIQFTFFTSIDVVRHPLVQKIIEAYEKEGEST